MISTPELMAERTAPRVGGRGLLAAGVALFVFGCASRFFRLGDWSFWADELATLRDARNLGAVRYYPVGYALIGWAVRLWGESELAARLVPAVAGAVTVPVVYVMGARLFSRRAGVAAGGVMALSTYHIFFSQFARYYSLLVLFGALGMWALYVGIERDRKVWLMTGLGLLGLGFFTHWSAGLLLPAAGVYLLWSARGRRPRGLNGGNVALLAGPMVVAGVALLPAVWGFVGGWGEGAGFSLRRIGLTGLKLGWRLEPAVLLFAAAGGAVLLRERHRAVKWLLSYTVLPLAAAPVFVGFSQGGSRFGIVALPAVALLAGGAVDRFFAAARGKGKALLWCALGLAVFAMGMKCVAYFTVEYGQRPRWREAGAMAQQGGLASSGYLISTSPAMLEHYGGGLSVLSGVIPLAAVPDEELARYLAWDGTTKGTPAFVFIEHVANVAPSAEQWKIIRQYAKKVKEWPVRVGPLDYTVSVYANKDVAKRYEDSR